MVKHNKVVKEYSSWEILEGSIENAIDSLQKIKDEINKDGYNVISVYPELDYSSCYYEGETPTMKIIITGTKT